jgi:hypothetical protein
MMHRSEDVENFQGLARGETVELGQSTQFVGPNGPAQIDRATERPTRLNDGDFLDAVNRAVLRQIEGGMVPADRVTTMGFVANSYNQFGF